jgi:hypothetical protein
LTVAGVQTDPEVKPSMSLELEMIEEKSATSGAVAASLQ